MKHRNKLDSKELDEMAMVVERLRQSKEAVELAEAREGATAGREWAMWGASYRQLSEVARMAKDNVTLYDGETDDLGLNLALKLVMKLNGAYGEEHDPKDLKEEMFSSAIRQFSMHYIEAFMKAAAEILEEVFEEVELIVF